MKSVSQSYLLRSVAYSHLHLISVAVAPLSPGRSLVPIAARLASSVLLLSIGRGSVTQRLPAIIRRLSSAGAVNECLRDEIFSGNAEADGRTISYGAIQRDTELGCSKKHPEACRVPEANPYNRGCNEQLGCRTTPSAS
ncbi:hypothetical protein HN51_019587 [Arachis hypogaea]